MNEDLLKELDKQKSLLQVKDSDGGKVLLGAINDDLTALIDKLVSIYKEANITQLQAIIASIEAKRDIKDLLVNSLERVESLKDELGLNKK